jgi:transmembrane 9 superfamily protein 2/4
VGTVVYTYDVIWERSDVPWSQRWDIFLMSGDDDDIHWFSIINSLMIVLFLTGMIAMILVRNLYRDIARYNSEEAAQASEEAAEETGWKLVHGDVFRPPAGFFGPMFLSVFVGSGMQLLAMCAAALLFAVLGFLSPANQGSLLTGFIVLFMCMGSFAGYTSARIYKMFRGKAWKRNTTLTAFAFPGTIYSVAFVLNLFVWAKRSSLAIPVRARRGRARVRSPRYTRKQPFLPAPASRALSPAPLACSSRRCSSCLRCGLAFRCRW